MSGLDKRFRMVDRDVPLGTFLSNPRRALLGKKGGGFGKRMGCMGATIFVGAK